MSRPFVRDITPKRLFFRDCPRYPEVPSAKSRAGVRDIPNQQPHPQTKSRTTGETPRDIADIGPKKVGISRTQDQPKLGRSRTLRIGSGYRGQSANLVTSRTLTRKNATARVGRSKASDRGRVGRGPSHSAEGRVAPAGGGLGCPRPTQATATTRRQGCTG
jgi:hypothetical protein